MISKHKIWLALQEKKGNLLIDNTNTNECTKVQNPRYIDVTLNAYTSALTKIQA